MILLWKLDSLMECTGDNVSLLLGCKFDKVYSVAGNSDGKLRIILGMLLSIKQCVSVKYIYIKMMAAL